MSSGFGGRVVFDMNTSPVFPQDVLAAITLVRSGAENRRARARVGCEAGLSLCLVAVTALLGVGSGPKLLEQNP